MVIINKLLNPKYSDKMAAFDYDWTIVNPKGGKTFPLIVDDWEWYSSNVKNIIRDYYNNGFMIVIFTNQSKNFWRKNMDYEDLHDTMNRIVDKAQDSIENLCEQYEGSKNDGVDINKRDIDHAFEALRSSIEMSME